MKNNDIWIEKSEDLVLTNPVKMTQDYIGNEKKILLLMFFLCIKARYSDSRMPKLIVKEVEKLCGCNTHTACLLIKWAKSTEHSDIFKYNPKTNSLVARNVKKKYTKKLVDKYGEDIWCINVIKIDKFKTNEETGENEPIEFNFKYLKKELRKQLLMDIIGKYMRKDKWTMYGWILFIPTYKQMAKAIGGVSNRTVNRLLKELEKEGRITKEESAYLRVIATDCSSKEEAIKLKRKSPHSRIAITETGLVYESMPNFFRLTGQGHGQPRFVILNHKRRMTQYAKKDDDCLFDKWDR